MTLGSSIDELIAIDIAMWDAQELLYEIRRMSFEAFHAAYFLDSTGAESLWKIFKGACDLNIQRNKLIDEVDESLLGLLR